MPSLTDRLKLLRGEPAEAVACFAASALPHAEPPERETLLRAAMASRQTANVAAAIAHLHHVGPAVMQELVESSTPLAPAFGLLRRRGDVQALLNAVAVVRRRAEPRLLGQVVACLDVDDDELPRRAAETLLAIVVAHVGPDGRRRAEPEAARVIDEAVTSAAGLPAARRYDEVALAAAILAPRAGPRLSELLADPDHPIAFSLRRVAGRTDRPLVRRNLLRWLTVKGLSGQVARRLHGLEGPREWSELLEGGHLLLVPARRRAARQAERPDRCLPDPASARRLTWPAQANLVRLVRALGPRQRRRLADCTALACPTARILAAIELRGDGSPAATAAVDALGADPCEAVAWLAGSGCLSGVSPRSRHRLETSPHRLIARRAVAAAARESTDAFFERWMRLDPLDRLAAGLTLIEAGREAFVHRLWTVLARGVRDDKIAGIALTRRLRLVADLEAALTERVADPDGRVASAAVAALADAGTSGRSQAVRRALSHPDVRVKANAVETLVGLDRGAIASLADFVTSRDNRLRANTVRALLHATGGSEHLREMLRDRDPRHRVSAIWVADRGRAGQVVRELRRLARRDRLPEIRSRAATTLRRIALHPAPREAVGT